jgi:hypothetical protein
MATVVVEDGFTIRVYGPPREHPPVHAHVERGPEGLVIIRLSTGRKAQEVWAAYHMKDGDILKAFRLVEKYEASIREVWRRLHGQTISE